ncbi:ketoacyl-ACP synthase III family protein [Kitasatospora sp. NPDC085879]|uniref:ketoacyl-ACP synthase III family protein n=1 Tax=Kitasatospora sp. NPDC085879 TaxID=3154769 RepID=UPI003422797C
MDSHQTGAPLYVAGCASWLPPAVTAEQAVAAGEVGARDAARTGVTSVTVSTGHSAPEMAALAARVALRRADCPPQDVGLVLHASLYDQGHDLWAPASYVQRRALGELPEHAPAMEVKQVSNGGMASLELAAAYLRAGTDRPAALLTSGDVFCPPGFHRWTSDPGTVYADGGAALVLSRDGGFARLLGRFNVSEPRLEGMHRGAAPFAPAESGLRRVVDLDTRKREFLAGTGRAAAVAWVGGGQRRALAGGLASLGLEVGDIARFVLPHLGGRRLAATYFQPFGIDPERSTWPWSRSIGHLGGGDQFAGLAHLVETKQVGAGDRVVLVGVGAGFSWSCAVLELLACPDWAASDTWPDEAEDAPGDGAGTGG